MPDQVKANTQAQKICAAALVVMLFLALTAACSQTSTTQTSQTQQPSPPREASPQVKVTQTPVTPPPPPAKVELNNDEHGTTADLSEFTGFLKNVIKQREEQSVTRPGTDIIEKTVLVKTDRSVKLGEVLKVFQAIEEAGASPLKLLVKAKPVKEESRPYMLTLRVDIGNDENTEDVADGIELRYFDETPVTSANKSSLQERDALVEIPKEGEYVVNGKPVGKSALKSALEARLKEAMTPKKTIAVLIPENSQISYATLSELANAAFETNVVTIDLFILKP